ncbi:hypothetical protein GCM10010168_71070 [Actinoplanes ianthinogenes]|uniref:DUF3800 domain-containing protein n=1 Tax=Actinoplanes ianthinogenes TaxID=122358 RepID=A0ABN6CUS6_9ACTN|nr:hypothetical protein Aiant_79610 [Actinoplanes ianthinogenes]GGR42112.1 hypothetical protein GCM10010168_71070 [Actinoplanes ianthinogenes]
MQGGLPPAHAVTGAVVEIACDESGFSGTNLLHSGAPVITHASVDLSVGEAVELIGALRSGFRFAPHELKSGKVLRQGTALDWLLSAVAGRALVHVIDKELFLVTRVVDLLLGEPSYVAGTSLSGEQRAAALALYRAGRSAGATWDGFLSAFVDLVRTRRRQPDPQVADRFLEARDRLLDNGLRGDPVLTALRPEAVRTIMLRLDEDDRSIPPPLEPMLPALAETVLFWSRGERRVLVFHDEQSALTADRLTRLQSALTGNGISPLAGLVMVDSRDDPRVQVADLLAGIARRSAIDASLLSPTSLHDPHG